MLVHLGGELFLAGKEAIEHLSRFFERSAERQYFFELLAGIAHRSGIDVFEEDEDFRRLALLPSVQCPVKFLFRV